MGAGGDGGMRRLGCLESSEGHTDFVQTGNEHQFSFIYKLFYTSSHLT